MKINAKKLFDLKGTALPWLILGIVLLLINVLVIGSSRFEFQWGMLYTLAVLGIALVLSESKSSLVSGISVAVLGVLVVFAQLSSLPILSALILGVLAFAGILLSGFGWFDLKTKADFQMLTLVPFFLLAGWGILYFYQRLTSNGALPLNAATAAYHGGVILLCIDGIIRVPGAYKKIYIAYLALFIAVIGAFWLTDIMGWGLALIPPAH